MDVRLESGLGLESGIESPGFVFTKCWSCYIYGYIEWITEINDGKKRVFKIKTHIIWWLLLIVCCVYSNKTLLKLVPFSCIRWFCQVNARSPGCVLIPIERRYGSFLTHFVSWLKIGWKWGISFKQRRLHKVHSMRTVKKQSRKHFKNTIVVHSIDGKTWTVTHQQLISTKSEHWCAALMTS